MLQDTIAVIDVGHGNSAVLIDSAGVVVIDAGQGSALLQFLVEQGIQRIDVMLVSHADHDHLGGLLGVLSSGLFEFGVVRVNTDSEKASRAWDDLTYELDQLRKKGDVDFQPSLIHDDSGTFDQGNVRIEVLAPSAYLASKGPGSTDREGRALHTNSMSAVVRLCHEGRPIVLFPGDIDAVALANIVDDGIDITAPITVFPHHGGRPGGDPIEFTRQFCSAVGPDCVVFSIGRNKHANPREDVVRTIRETRALVWIACTQLSEHCADDTPVNAPEHLAPVHSQGRHKNCCCAGTILISAKSRAIIPNRDAHLGFINVHAPNALCRRTPRK